MALRCRLAQAKLLASASLLTPLAAIPFCQVSFVLLMIPEVASVIPQEDALPEAPGVRCVPCTDSQNAITVQGITVVGVEA